MARNGIHGAEDPPVVDTPAAQITLDHFLAHPRKAVLIRRRARAGDRPLRGHRGREGEHKKRREKKISERH
jgi:hypothetical protein